MSAHCNDCGTDLVYGTGEDWQLMTCPVCSVRAERDALAARVETLTAERDEWREKAADAIDMATGALQERDVKKARVETLENALRHIEAQPDSPGAAYYMRVAARAALASRPAGEETQG